MRPAVSQTCHKSDVFPSTTRTKCICATDIGLPVGESGTQHGDHRFEVRGKVCSQGFLVVNAVLSQSSLDDGEIPFIEGTLHKVPDEGFVGVGCHSFSPLIVVQLYSITI